MLDLMDDLSTLVDVQSKSVFGKLSPTAGRTVGVLSKDLSIQIFGDYSTTPSAKAVPGRSKKGTKIAQNLGIELNVVLYGPSKFFEPVGVFATKCNIYLQHPKHCDRDVPYHNPHCLTLEDGHHLSTYELHSKLDMACPVAFETPCNPIDMFLDTASQEYLLERATPTALSTPLYKHQKQALTFMTQRESGWALDERYKDMWKAETNNQGQIIYFNIITGQRQIRPPEQFRGGLLIDAPGLGKSLSIIALVATDLDEEKSFARDSDPRLKTLLAVPKSRKHGHSFRPNA